MQIQFVELFDTSKPLELKNQLDEICAIFKNEHNSKFLQCVHNRMTKETNRLEKHNWAFSKWYESLSSYNLLFFNVNLGSLGCAIMNYYMQLVGKKNPEGLKKFNSSGLFNWIHYFSTTILTSSFFYTCFYTNTIHRDKLKNLKESMKVVEEKMKEFV